MRFDFDSTRCMQSKVSSLLMHFDHGEFFFCFVMSVYIMLLYIVIDYAAYVCLSSAISSPQRFLTGFLKLFQFNYMVICKMSFDSIFYHFNRISRMRREWKKNCENVLNFLQLWFFLQIKPHHLTNLLAVSVWMDYQFFKTIIRRCHQS